jgi:hypothetical protein
MLVSCEIDHWTLRCANTPDSSVCFIQIISYSDNFINNKCKNIPLFTKYSYTLLAITLLFMAASLLCMCWFTEKSIREAATVLVIGSPPIFRAKLAICCLKKNFHSFSVILFSIENHPLYEDKYWLKSYFHGVILSISWKLMYHE